MRRRLLGLVGVLVLAGCNGGTVDHHALSNDSKTIDSMACEGAILANGIARGRTTVFFSREQAEELRIQASNLADALSKRSTVAGIEPQVRAKAKDAAKLAVQLQRLHDHPSDRAVGAAVEQKLKKAGGCP